jgi:hypothetical protein
MNCLNATLFGLPAPEPNPMISKYGRGPDGAKCKNCRLLIAHQFSRTYYKCQLRGDTRGPATDHRMRWDACGRFVPVPELATVSSAYPSER